MVNPNPQDHPYAAGIMGALYSRGEALVNGVKHKLQGNGETLQALWEGRFGDAAAIRYHEAANGLVAPILGFGSTLRNLGNALGDLGYYSTHGGSPDTSRQIGAAAAEVALDLPNVVLAVAGGVGIARGIGAAGEGVSLNTPSANLTTSVTTTGELFGEIEGELSGVPEAQGAPSAGHHGPGLTPEPGQTPPTGIYGRDGGHHVHQGAAYVPEGTKAQGTAIYQNTTTVPLEGSGHTNVHRVTNALNRGMHGAEVNKTIPVSETGGSVTVTATGDGLGRPPASPWAMDQSGYYSLRASGDLTYGTQSGAFNSVVASDRRLTDLGVNPIRQPKR